MAMKTQSLKAESFRDIPGKDIDCHHWGNNAAFSCPCCGYPVLAVFPKNMTNMTLGDCSDKPTVCRKCMTKFWVENTDTDLILHRV